jgi:hypothetical protein
LQHVAVQEVLAVEWTRILVLRALLILPRGLVLLVLARRLLAAIVLVVASFLLVMLVAVVLLFRSGCIVLVSARLIINYIHVVLMRRIYQQLVFIVLNR